MVKKRKATKKATKRRVARRSKAKKQRRKAAKRGPKKRRPVMKKASPITQVKKRGAKKKKVAPESEDENLDQYLEARQKEVSEELQSDATVPDRTVLLTPGALDKTVRKLPKVQEGEPAVVQRPSSSQESQDDENDFSKCKFTRYGHYYEQWRDQVFEETNKNRPHDSSKHMVITKQLSGEGAWPSSVEEYNALGVVFLSIKEAITLESRVLQTRLLGRGPGGDRQRETGKYLSLLKSWLEEVRTHVKDGNLESAFEALVSCTIAAFDEIPFFLYEKKEAKPLEQMAQLWSELLAKTDEELHIEPISRDGVKKMLEDRVDLIPEPMKEVWQRSLGTVTEPPKPAEEEPEKEDTTMKSPEKKPKPVKEETDTAIEPKKETDAPESSAKVEKLATPVKEA